MGFSREEHWSGEPFSSPGELPDPWIKPGSLALQVDSSPFEPPEKPLKNKYLKKLNKLVVCTRSYREGNGTPLQCTPAWKIPWTEEPGSHGVSPWGRKESDTTERLHFHFSLLCIGEGNGNPLQCSCLENPRDGVAESRTRLK